MSAWDDSIFNYDEELLMMNNHRVCMMLSDITSHVSRGIDSQKQDTIKVDKWQVVQQNCIEVRKEGVLLSTKEADYTYVYPKGVYKCNCCDKDVNMDHQNPCYYSSSSYSIICPACKEAEAVHPKEVRAGIEKMDVDDIFSYLFPRPRVLEYAKTDKHHYEVIDMRLTAEELQSKREETRSELQIRSSDMNTKYIYVDDKTIEDIYQERLARRAVNRWRRYMEKQRRLNLMMVLYHCAGLGMNASLMLARTTQVM